MNKRISIVTSVKNAGEFLERALFSVLNQGYDNLEIIAADGGSSDNTVEILEKYNIPIVSRKDDYSVQGANRCYRKTTGDIWGLLNYDDEYLTGSLQRISDEFQDDNLDWLYSPLDLVNNNGDVVETMGYEDYQPTLQTMMIKNTIPGVSVFLSKRITEKVFPDGDAFCEEFSIANDYVIWMKLLSQGVVPKKINQNLVLYHKTGKNMGDSPRGLEVMEIVRQRYR